MSKLSVFAAVVAASAVGLVSHLLHTDSKKSAAVQLKAVAQAELDNYKPYAIMVIQQAAQSAQGEVVSHANAAELSTLVSSVIDKSSLPADVKMTIKAAAAYGIMQANVPALAAQGTQTLQYLTAKVCASIDGWKL